MEIFVEVLSEGGIRGFDILIFVTVGSHDQGFDRLIKAIDDLIRDKKIKEKVIIQTGHTEYVPQNCEWFKFTSYENFIELCRKSHIIITHGGVGSIMVSLKLKKPTIVIPRLKKFNEHIDNHQLQIVKELEKQKKIIAVYDVSQLNNAIKIAKSWSSYKIKFSNLVSTLIEEFIQKNKKSGEFVENFTN